MDIKGMQYYHYGYVNYNDNGLNNGMNCANGFHVYCHTHRKKKKKGPQDFSSREPQRGSDLTQTAQK